MYSRCKSRSDLNGAEARLLSMQMQVFVGKPPQLDTIPAHTALMPVMVSCRRNLLPLSSYFLKDRNFSTALPCHDVPSWHL